MPLQAARDAADAHDRFVWVNDDGSTRELSPEECAYLATPFEGPDGGRPYIKESYRSLTPDKRMRGFLELQRLPGELHHRVRRGGFALPVKPRRLLDGRAIAHALGTIFAVALAGYLGLLIGAFVALPVSRPSYDGIRVVLFFVAAGSVTLFYILVGPINFLLSTDSLRFPRFYAVTAAWLGALGGAIWVVWLHGDPSRILLIRAMH